MVHIQVGIQTYISLFWQLRSTRSWFVKLLSQNRNQDSRDITDCRTQERNIQKQENKPEHIVTSKHKEVLKKKKVHNNIIGHRRQIKSCQWPKPEQFEHTQKSVIGL